MISARQTPQPPRELSRGSRGVVWRELREKGRRRGGFVGEWDLIPENRCCCGVVEAGTEGAGVGRGGEVVGGCRGPICLEQNVHGLAGVDDDVV